MKRNLLKAGACIGIAAASSGIAAAAASAIKGAQNKTPVSKGEHFRNAFKAAVSFGLIVQPVQYLRSIFGHKNTETFSLKKFGDYYDLLKVFFFLIPRISNPLMIALLHGISFFGNIIYKKKDYGDDSENPLLNEKERGFFTAGEFIENQRDWSAVRFGLTNMCYAGCEIMAVYNAQLALGKDMSARDMVNLIHYFERNGAVAFGYGGTSPVSIIRYFTAEGYSVNKTFSKKTDRINEIGENSDTVIVTAYNDKYDVSEMIHTVSITKDKNGNFALHNGYQYTGDLAVALDKVSGEPIRTLKEIIDHMSGDGNARAICVIGISKQELDSAF